MAESKELASQESPIPEPEERNHPRIDSEECLGQTLVNPLGCGNCFFWAWMMAIFLQPDSSHKELLLGRLNELGTSAINFVKVIRSGDMKQFLTFMNQRLRSTEAISFKNTRSYQFMTLLRQLSKCGPNEEYMTDLMVIRFIQFISGLIENQYFLILTYFQPQTLSRQSNVSPMVIGIDRLGILESRRFLAQTTEIHTSVVLRDIHFVTPRDQVRFQTLCSAQLDRIIDTRAYSNIEFDGIAPENLNWTVSDSRKNKKKKAKKQKKKKKQ